VSKSLQTVIVGAKPTRRQFRSSVSPAKYRISDNLKQPAADISPNPSRRSSLPPLRYQSGLAYCHVSSKSPNTDRPRLLCATRGAHNRLETRRIDVTASGKTGLVIERETLNPAHFKVASVHKAVGCRVWPLRRPAGLFIAIGCNSG